MEDQFTTYCQVTEPEMPDEREVGETEHA